MNRARIGQHVTHAHDHTPGPRVGTIIAVLRRCPDRVIVCWAPTHEHDDTQMPDWTLEHLDHLGPRTPAVLDQ